MTKETKDFVEAYNRCMEWNKEIRDRSITTLYHFNDVETTSDLIKGYLDTEKITEENTDLDDVRIYPIENARIKRLEMQAFSRSSLRQTFYYITPDQTKEEYMQVKMNELNRTIRALQCQLSGKILKLSNELDTLNHFASYINNKQSDK